MEIRHLRLIKAIVEEGSLTRAIDKLHLTQSALSHQLREAENQLGTKVFDRVSKKLVLTRAGEKIYTVATEIIEKLNETEQQVKQMIYGEFGEIRISTECYTVYHWLPALMKRFHSAYPNVELRIVMEGTQHPLEKLLAGEIDIAITSDPLKDDRIGYLDLFQDELFAIVPPNHNWATRKFIKPEDFADQTLLIHSLPLDSVAIYRLFLKPAGILPEKVMPIPLTEAAVEMAKAEMGVMVMPHWAIAPYLKTCDLQLVKIGRNGVRRKHYIGHLRTREHPEYFFRFTELLQREITVS